MRAPTQTTPPPEALLEGWQTLPPLSQAAMQQARLALHQAVQWPSAVARSYLRPDPSDATASLVWDEGYQGFRTDYFGGMFKYAMVLRVADYSLHMVSWSKEVNESLPLGGKAPTEIDEWVRHQLAKGNFRPERYLRELPYQVPAEVAQPTGPLQKPDAQALQGHAFGYHSAWQLLNAFMLERADAQPLRLWPHHFDIGAYQTVVASPNPEASRTVGWGYSSGDGDGQGPYFYLNAWPYQPGEAVLQGKLPGGHWQTEGWTGAVLPYSALAALPDAAQQATLAWAFLHQGYAHLHGLVAGR